MHSRLLALVAATILVVPLAAQQPTAVSLVITNGIVITVDGSRRVLNPGAVAINGRDIVAVDTPAAIAGRYTAAQTIDASGKVVMPGLINTHTHAAMVMFRGLGNDLNLMDWLQKYIFPAEAKTVSPEFVRIGTNLALLEMIQSGTTTFADMYYFEDEVAKVTKAAGMRGVLGQTVIEFPVPDAKTPADALARTEAFARQFDHDELITPSIAPHAVYTLDAKTLSAVSAMAKRLMIPIQIHLAETSAENGLSQDRHKMRPVAILDSLNFWAPTTLAAHAVWINDEEIALLKKRGVGVSNNPESNMKLSSGTAPVMKYRAAGVSTGIGTDGAASNNDLDMFEAMRQAAFQQKLVTMDPTAISAADALEMATLGGAAALGRRERLGSIEAGKLADIIIVSLAKARQQPVFDPVSQIVYASRGDDVETTIVNGRVLMRDRKVLTMDETAVIAAARTAADLVRKAVAQ
ncbi:MAG: 5-methylthioadenosine/S-adenosylhomocysteine deaminase [Acidobacteriota bacterium]|jgi:5-methylthioadenosine/S-adenosylhomocysteine deaminase